jgi:predicted nucleic acid-binding protein
MGIKYLWDTNIAIYYLQRQFPPSAEQFMDSILQDFQPTISAITEIELLCWKTASESDLVVLRDFIEDCVVFELLTRNTSDFKLIPNLELVNPWDK